MRYTFLDTICDAKRARIAAAKECVGTNGLKRKALRERSFAEPHRLRSCIKGEGVNIVAEIKRASPSKGVLNARIDVFETAVKYQNGGAAAISVLTEEDYFKGSLEDLRIARGATSLPILRKDFIFDDFQIYEAAAAGADAVLLIAAMLNDGDLRRLFHVAERALGIDALVEVHNKAELDRAASIGATLIGVNNRDLHSFDVSLDVSRELIAHKPADALMIAESGISTREEIVELHSVGFNGFLIGEAFMRSGDPVAEIQRLSGAKRYGKS